MALTVNVNGPVYGTTDRTERVMGEMGPALERGVAQYERELGRV